MEEFMFNKITLSIFLLFVFSVSHSLYSEMHWSETSTLSSATELSKSQIAFNKKGQGIAVWIEIDSPFSSKLLYSTCEDFKWTTPKVFTSAQSFLGHTVNINESGKIVVVWNQMTNGPMPSYSNIEAVIFNGQTWVKPQTLHISWDERISIPKVALSESDEVLVAWITDGESSTESLIALTYENQTWSKPTTLATNVTYHQNFDIDLNKDGQGVVAWFNKSNCVETTRYERSSWSPSSVVSPPNVVGSQNIIASYADTAHPGIVWVANHEVINNENIIAAFPNLIYPDTVWVTTTETENTFEYTWFTPNEGWLKPNTIGTFGGDANNCKFDLAVNIHGAGLAAWGEQDGSLKVSRFHSVNEPVISTLTTNFNAQSGNVNVSVNDEGNGAAIWNEGAASLIGNVCIGTNWMQEPHAFSHFLKVNTRAQIALDDANQVTALWTSATPVDKKNFIQTAFGQENAKGLFFHTLNIQAKHCMNSKGSQKDSTEIKWNPSEDSQIKRYALYRNNFLIAQLPASQEKCTDLYYEGIMVYRIDVLDQNDQVLATSNTKLN